MRLVHVYHSQGHVNVSIVHLHLVPVAQQASVIGGLIFMYSCSQTVKQSSLKENNDAEDEYMGI